MREILFRGKRVDNGEWIRGDLITTPFIRNETQQNIIYILDIAKADYDCFEDLVEDNGIFEVDPETVCQYTGLTDKNSRKIFEGDICKYYNPEDKDGIAVIREDYAEWISGTIRQKEIMTPIFYLKCSKEWEVIGNIFDNPELENGMEELKKCPFCGSEAIMYGYGQRKMVYCKNDNCRLGIAPKVENNTDAIRKWNERVNLRE